MRRMPYTRACKHERARKTRVFRSTCEGRSAARALIRELNAKRRINFLTRNYHALSRRLTWESLTGFIIILTFASIISRKEIFRTLLRHSSRMLRLTSCNDKYILQYEYWIKCRRPSGKSSNFISALFFVEPRQKLFSETCAFNKLALLLTRHAEGGIKVSTSRWSTAGVIRNEV